MSETTNKLRWELSGDLIIDRREKVYVAQLTEPGSRNPSPLEIDSERWLLASGLAKDLVSAANARDALLAACRSAVATLKASDLGATHEAVETLTDAAMMAEGGAPAPASPPARYWYDRHDGQIRAGDRPVGWVQPCCADDGEFSRMLWALEGALREYGNRGDKEK